MAVVAAQRRLLEAEAKACSAFHVGSTQDRQDAEQELDSALAEYNELLKEFEG